MYLLRLGLTRRQKHIKMMGLFNVGQGGRMQIYLARDGVQAGPYTTDEFNQMRRHGQVKDSDWMWYSGMDAWRTVAQQTGGAMPYHPSGVILTKVPKMSPKTSPSATTSTQDSVHCTAKNMHQPSINEASAGQRLGACFINVLCFFGCIWPLVLGMGRLVNLQDPSYTAYLEALEENANLSVVLERTQAMLLSLDGGALQITFWALCSFFIVQSGLSIFRGQSVGKLFLNLYVIDPKTRRHAGFWRTYVLRGVLLLLIYYILAVVLNLFAVVLILAIHYWRVKKDGSGIHDRFSKTAVIYHKKGTSK